MKTLFAEDHGLLMIGAQGEKNATQVIFDLSKWIREFGLGSAHLTVRPAGDLFAYPAKLSRSDAQATWLIGPEWTATSGEGACQLIWYTADVVVKTAVWQTYVRPALGESNAAAPGLLSGHLEQVQALVDRAEAAAKAAERYADLLKRGGGT